MFPLPLWGPTAWGSNVTQQTVCVLCCCGTGGSPRLRRGHSWVKTSSLTGSSPTAPQNCSTTQSSYTFSAASFKGWKLHLFMFFFPHHMGLTVGSLTASGKDERGRRKPLPLASRVCPINIWIRKPFSKNI